MLKFLLILFLIPSMVFGQEKMSAVQANAPCWPSENTLGYIYNKSSFTNTSDFTLNGGITMALSAGAVNIGGGAGTFDHYATVLTPHAFSNYSVTMDVKMINAANISSYGVGLGLRSINATFPQDIFGWVNLSTSATPGQIFLYNSSGSLLSSSAGKITWSTNDVIRQTFALQDTVILFTVQNITTGGPPVSVTIRYVNSLSPPLTRPNGSNFSIYEIGGTFQLQSLSINVSDKTNTNIAVASDSKFGYYAGNWAFAWPALLNATYPTVTRFSGSGDEAAHAIKEIYNLSLLNPHYLIWEYGSNDLRKIVPLSTVTAYSDSVYNYFAARGTTVYFILIPEDSTAGGIGQKSLDLWYRSHYPSNYISAVWDSLSINNITKPGYLADGNVHLNAAGHAKVAEALTVSNKFNVQGVCGTCESPLSQAYISNSQTGNQVHRGELGMEFLVNNPSGIIIKQLGAFDDGNNGITGLQPGGSVRVAVFSRATKNIIAGLDVTISGAADAYTGNHRMKNISPVTLPPGDYVLVAKGYHAGERNGNSFNGGGPYPSGDNNGGAITFGNETSFGPDNPVGFNYPNSAGNYGSTHQFLAGTFSFTKVISCGAPSTNANLSSLVLSTASLTPAFDAATISYTASVANSIASITVTPTAADAGAIITVNGNLVASGAPSASIPLAVGNNNIAIVVKAEDGTTTKTYTVTVSRAVASGCESSAAQAYISNTQTGNQSHRGELGMQFIVNNPGGIIIKQLGAFDDGNNGISGLQPGGGVRVAVFSRSTHNVVTGLDVTISGVADAYTGNHRMKNISPVTLPQGDYVIVAKGYHAGEKNGNSYNGGGPHPAGNTGAGAISFGNETSFGPDDPNGFSYPNSAGNYGNSPVFLAGTFNFTTILSCAPGIASNTPIVPADVALQVEPLTTGLALKTKSLILYPNPTKGQFSVLLSDAGGSAVTIQVMNSNGKRVQLKTISLPTKTASLRIPFNLENQPPGVYLVRILSAKGIRTEKLVIGGR